ncbi:MAG: hypothetical protein PHV42_02860 [Candidatus Pacebacteria bacterium]|nr:hypothetical protein [Candidatus Paceibacterota bacterium]
MSGAIRKINPAWVLRLFLGLTFLYSGLDMTRNPSLWTWTVSKAPLFLTNFIHTVGGITNFIRGVGYLELVFVALFLIPIFPRIFVKIASLLAGIEMSLIVISLGINMTTFRDIGLAGAAFSLFILLVEHSHSHDWR